MADQELRLLRERRDVAERDTGKMQREVKEAKAAYEDLLTNFRELQKNGDLRQAEVYSELKMKSFEVRGVCILASRVYPLKLKMKRFEVRGVYIGLWGGSDSVQQAQDDKLRGAGCLYWPLVYLLPDGLKKALAYSSVLVALPAHSASSRGEPALTGTYQRYLLHLTSATLNCIYQVDRLSLVLQEKHQHLKGASF
jgi:hypothetical protein